MERTQSPAFRAVIALIAQRAGAEQTRVVPVSERVGQQRQGRVGHVVLQRVRDGGVARKVLGVEPQRDIAFLDIGVDVGPHAVLRTGRRGRLAHRLVGLGDIEIPKALHPAVDDHRDRRVPLHREGLAAVKLPFRKPTPLLVHPRHRAQHLPLTIRVDKRQQLVQVAAGVPQREDRITFAIRHARLARTFHQRVFAVHVAHEVRVQQRMVQRRVEHPLLLLGAALDPDSAQSLVPALAGLFPDGVERRVRGLLGIEVFARVLRRDIRNAHAHLHLLARRKAVEGEPVAHVVARKLAPVLRIEFISPVVRRPLGLHSRHLPLLLPIAAGTRSLRNAQHEVHRENLLRIVAERPQQLRALDLRGAHPANHRAALVRKPLAQIQQDMPFSSGERVAFHRGTRRGRGFGKDAVLVQKDRVIARGGLFVPVRRAVLPVIHRQRARRGHRQQRAQLGAPHAAQGAVREAREEFVVVFVGRGPPAGVLVVDVLLRPHDVERNHRHHPVRRDRTGVRGPEVRSPDERIHTLRRLLCPCSQTQRQNRKQRKASHRMLFFFVKSMISGI